MAALLVAGVLIENGGVWLNLSPSMPSGLYLSRHVRDGRVAFRRGMIVALFPAYVARSVGSRAGISRARPMPRRSRTGRKAHFRSRRRYGDVSQVASRAIASRFGRRGALSHDRAGRPLPQLPQGTYPVETGEVWLVSTHTALSWDSRYYGAVPTANVIAVLRPLWIASSDRGAP